MAITRKIIFALALTSLALLGFTGCASEEKESAIPWARPASFENQVPGMSMGH